MQRYDVVILGSGLGGLVTAALLGKKGKRVMVLEKNKQIGGNLQTFSRNKLIFDSGVHYIGGLAKGENLYQIFQYLGIMDQLQIRRMDESAFDKIIIEGDEQVYPHAQGYDRFIQQLTALFPGEQKAIAGYCQEVQATCAAFPLYQLKLEEKNYSATQSVEDVLSSITNNRKLQAVLAGNNLLYAGEAGKTPFYVHALIANSYIQSAWKCIRGGSQIAKVLSKKIREQGGELLKYADVIHIEEQEGKVLFVETRKGDRYYADQFVSNIDPVLTIQMTHTSMIRKIYRERLEQLENTISSFSLHIVLNKQSHPYENSNYYYHKEGMLWRQNEYTSTDWPRGYALFMTADEENPAYAESITIFTVMRYEEVAKWADTFNTVAEEHDRGNDYDDFKHQKARKLLDLVEEKFPGLRSKIATYYTSTPLSYRDYIGSRDGTMYGFAKDVNDPLKTTISPRTKIPNLFLTGQNLNMHGILGTTLSAVLTSTMMLDNEKIVEEIRHA